MRNPAFFLRLIFVSGLLLMSSRGSAESSAPNDPLFLESVRLFENKKYQESLRNLSTLIHRQPEETLYWFNAGNCLYMLKKYDASLRAYQKVISLKGKLSIPAQLYSAKAMKALGRHADAHQILESLLQSALPRGLASEVRRDLDRLDEISAREEMALKLYQTGDVANAEAELKKIPHEDRSADGRLLLGMVLLKEKKYVESRRTMENAKRGSGWTAEQRSLIADLIKRARRDEGDAHPYWLLMDISYGQTDNAYADGKSVAAVTSPLSRVQVGLGYHFHQSEKWSQKVSYSLFQEDPQRASELKALYQTVQGSLLYQASSLDVSFGPYIQRVHVNSTLAAEKLGLTLKVIFTRDPWDFSLEADHSEQKALDSDFGYLQGASTSFKPAVGWWDRSFYAQAFWILGRDGSTDISYSDGSLLPLSHNYQGPGLKLVWRPSDEWAAVLTSFSLQKNYSNSALPGSKIRKDTEVGSSLKVLYSFTPRFSVYGMGEWVANSSTLGADDVRDKNYQVLVWTGGLSWDVF